MKIIDRHVGFHVIVATMLALAVLVALFAFVTFVDDLDTVGRRNYELTNAVQYLLLSIPRLIFNLFPVAAVIGSLAGLGLLASQHELTVMRTAGVSVARLTVSLMKAAGVLVILSLLVGEVVAPYAERLAEEGRAKALAGLLSLRTANGIWVRDGSSFLFIRYVVSDDSMKNLAVYEVDEDWRLRVATSAKTATYDGEQWQLTRIRQSILDERQVDRVSLRAGSWVSDFKPDLVDIVAVRPESLSAIGLLKYMVYLRANGLSTQRYEMALWTKLVYPLATGVMILLAVPLVLGRMSRTGTGQRILVGALVGVSFHVVHQASGQLGLAYGLSPFVSAIMPTALAGTIAIVLIRRIR